jgi:predicted CoA-binding protein
MPLITDPAGLGDLLAASRTIAIVGWSPNPSRPSHSVAEYLRTAGFRVFPVNPEVGTASGNPAFSSLREIPEPIDIVTVFRRPEYVPEVVEDVLAVRAKTLWLQDGVVHAEAADRAMAAGLRVVMDRCIRRDHRRLIAGGAASQSLAAPAP